MMHFAYPLLDPGVEPGAFGGGGGGEGGEGNTPMHTVSNLNSSPSTKLLATVRRRGEREHRVSERGRPSTPIFICAAPPGRIRRGGKKKRRGGAAGPRRLFLTHRKKKKREKQSRPRAGRATAALHTE